MLMVQNCDVAHSMKLRVVQNCDVARERVNAVAFGKLSQPNEENDQGQVHSCLPVIIHNRGGGGIGNAYHY